MNGPSFYGLFLNCLLKFFVMKKKIIITALTILFISFLIAFKIVSNVLPIGSSLPKADVKMKDVSGNTVTMNEAKKKNGLLVMFSCNTCPYVIRNQQRTRQFVNMHS